MTRATRAERLAQAHDELVAAVEAMTGGEEWRRLLSVARRFHTYSVNNLLLICRQRPDATRVAGYQTWQSLGRQVRRGERGLAILAPCTYARSNDGKGDDPPTASTDDQGGEGRPSRVLRGFKVVHVFDVSQTDGDPLPEAPVTILSGETPAELTDRLATLIQAEGYTFTLGPLPPGYDGANGLTDHDQRVVIVRDDLPDAQRAKTTAHELAHVLMHGTSPRPRRSVVEVEAESVAFLVCGSAGLPSDAYSFGYVATWAQGDTALIRATAERSIRCARGVLDALDPDSTHRAA
ncbi:MAG TPA: ArdC-like ssDNA-binding domain-containing protein [Iamia sp.]|nr:ArdC-like ssDNA-binding domain-containing protein [Iamia sp.]